MKETMRYVGTTTVLIGGIVAVLALRESKSIMWRHVRARRFALDHAVAWRVSLTRTCGAQI